MNGISPEDAHEELARLKAGSWEITESWKKRKKKSPKKMSDADRLMQYAANQKSTAVAYLLWLFFWMLGAHRFYLGRTGSAIVILLCTFAGVLCTFAGGFLFLAGLVCVAFGILDFFYIPTMVREANTRLAAQLRA